jgi:hypothetical protein
MGEVEITSEFAQLMIKGLVGKTQKAIDNLYLELDEEWPERGEVERRFRHCTDEIDSAVGGDIANTTFTSRAAFYALFAAVYDATFEMGLPLKRKKAEPLPSALKTRLMKTSDAIRNQTAPENLLESLARRTTHKDSRKTVVDYLRNQLLRA